MKPTDQMLYLAGKVPVITTPTLRDTISGAPVTIRAGFPVGHYNATEADGTRWQFGVLPADYAAPAWLGSTANVVAHDTLNDRNAIVGAPWTRFGAESDFRLLRPSATVWDWSKLDARFANNAGRKIICEAWGIPNWATADQRLAVWTETVKALVARYAGKITLLEIWNEPWTDNVPLLPGMDWLQTYTALAKAEKSVSGSIPLIGPAWADYRLVETKQLIALGAFNYLDGISFHYYDGLAQDPDSAYWDIGNLLGYSGAAKMPGVAQGIRDLKALLPGKLVVVDEVGIYGQSGIGLPPTSTWKYYVSPLPASVAAHRAYRLALALRTGGADVVIPHLLTGAGTQGELEGWEQAQGVHVKTWAFLMACDSLRRLEAGIVTPPVPAPAPVPVPVYPTKLKANGKIKVGKNTVNIILTGDIDKTSLTGSITGGGTGTFLGTVQ